MRPAILAGFVVLLAFPTRARAQMTKDQCATANESARDRPGRRPPAGGARSARRM